MEDEARTRIILGCAKRLTRTCLLLALITITDGLGEDLLLDDSKQEKEASKCL